MGKVGPAGHTQVTSEQTKDADTKAESRSGALLGQLDGCTPPELSVPGGAVALPDDVDIGASERRVLELSKGLAIRTPISVHALHGRPVVV